MIESSFMLISAFVGEIYNESAVTSLYLSALATFISGLTLSLIGRKRRKEKRISQREVYLTVTLVWVLMALYAALPFLLGGAIPSFTDAFLRVCADLPPPEAPR